MSMCGTVSAHIYTLYVYSAFICVCNISIIITSFINESYIILNNFLSIVCDNFSFLKMSLMHRERERERNSFRDS
jgi:hypothetical protein